MDTHTLGTSGGRAPARQVICQAHEGCTWRRDLAGDLRDDDPIVLALVRAHAAERREPVPPMMGHPRRARA